ncbi:MAG: DUF1330 domain-containing protein [Gemmatimonadota bacterium]|nr:MAG: DUF1330 domain-containing protein [Gemmatimonadota bacterium]
MSAYVIVDIHITDPVRYEDYKKMAGPTLAAFGGKFVVRGGAVETLEGDWDPGRVVVLEFPDLERAREWWASDAYGPAKRLRQECARSEMILVQGT